MPLPFEWASLVLIAKERKADVHMRVRPGAILEADKIIQALVAENLRLNKEAYTWWEAAVQRKPADSVGLAHSAQPVGLGLGQIEGDAIVLRFSADALAFAFANDPQAHEPRPAVIDKRAFLRDVLGELTREKEDGSNPLTDVLDKAAVAAWEQGSEGLDFDSAAGVRAADNLCAVCGLSKHVAAHRTLVSGPHKGEPLDHEFLPPAGVLGELTPPSLEASSPSSVGINGLTEAETNATASVFGLVRDGVRVPDGSKGST